MLPLTPDDHALIAQARDAIRRNYDGVHENHTVGAAMRCADGSIFCGVNVTAPAPSRSPSVPPSP